MVIAVPSGPARDLEIEGVSEARLTSLRRQRHAWAAKFVAAYDEPFWRDARAERAGRERGRARVDLAAAARRAVGAGPSRAVRRVRGHRPGTRTREALDQIAELYGAEATSPLQTWTRLWGTDPWTQGYVTNWRPGDVEAVGPLHGTHEPPFYVAAPTSGSPATWRARSGPAGRRRGRPGGLTDRTKGST